MASIARGSDRVVPPAGDPQRAKKVSAATTRPGETLAELGRRLREGSRVQETLSGRAKLVE